MVLLIRRTVRPRGYASGFDSSAALPAERRVLARWGWVGEMSELFEHPAGTTPSCATHSDRGVLGSNQFQYGFPLIC
jgi:hypothetical protein